MPFLSYKHFSAFYADCELPSTETLNTLLKRADIEIPVVQLPKRNKNQSSKLKLWKLCPWLPKTYFSKIKADFTLHLEANKITELTTWLQLGHSARESWVEDVYIKHRLQIVANSDNKPEVVQQATSIFKKYMMMNQKNMDLTFRSSNEFQETDQEMHLNNNNDDSEFFGSNYYENCDSTTSDNYATPSFSNNIVSVSNRHITSCNYAIPASGSYIDPTSNSDNEIYENTLSQNFKDALKQNSTIEQITDRISSRTQQKGDTNSKKSNQRLKDSLSK
ncbi:6283_t:CDS:2 [Dentiscutata erythropus]|uniref:6283_t:CDS:1 n=1 Tax=Dentiscutata erythropus TaxID=1348616 RepID=A0A9N9F5I3_9GLOM|nr:6283_t:CDS:2 [Dentiscutata erythropus]